MGIVSQVVHLQCFQIRMSGTAIGTGVDWIVHWRTHDRVIGTSFVTGQGRQRQRVPKGRGICGGSNSTQIVRHDTWKSSRQTKGG